jgi:hypothetical protein
MRRSATVTWPLTARAQQPRKVPTIGFLGAGRSSVRSQWTAAFVQRLRELGGVEGRNVTIEYRSAEGRAERNSEIATVGRWHGRFAGKTGLQRHRFFDSGDRTSRQTN